jgi:transposase
MESTGVFWKPIFNILESRFKVLLVNARHIKQVPGRKSDLRDCQWIAQLLQCGLLKGRFIPPRAQRELRDLTRHRTQVVEEKTRTINRIRKALEDANIMLASVAADVMGVSGRAMIQRLIEWETPLHAGRSLSHYESGVTYADLGGDFFDRLEPQRLTRYYVKRLEPLGHKGTLEATAAA